MIENNAKKNAENGGYTGNDEEMQCYSGIWGELVLFPGAWAPVLLVLEPDGIAEGVSRIWTPEEGSENRDRNPADNPPPTVRGTNLPLTPIRASA